MSRVPALLTRVARRGVPRALRRSPEHAAYNDVMHALHRLNPEHARFTRGRATRQTTATYESSNLHLDRIYSFARRLLLRDLFWRYGPPFVRDTASGAFRRLQPHATVIGRTFCELGCGTMHPFGTAAIMFVNGAERCLATDVAPADEVRAAEALYDLLLDVLAHPDDWHWSEIDRESLLARVRRFELRALQHGELKEGLAAVPIEHVITDIHDPALPGGTVDLMTSRATLEHFLDFPRAASRLADLMSEDGVACHLVDFADHRSYSDPDHHHAWSMLAEDEGWSDGLVNRLRPAEMIGMLEEAGFELLARYDETGDLPPDFRDSLRGRFREMPDTELSVLRSDIVLRRRRTGNDER